MSDNPMGLPYGFTAPDFGPLPPVAGAAERAPSEEAIAAFVTAAAGHFWRQPEAALVSDIRQGATEKGLRAAYAVDFPAVPSGDAARAASEADTQEPTLDDLRQGIAEAFALATNKGRLDAIGLEVGRAAVARFEAALRAAPAAEPGEDAVRAAVAMRAEQQWTSLESLCAWLLHRFGPNSPEGREATARLPVAGAPGCAAPTDEETDDHDAFDGCEHIEDGICAECLRERRAARATPEGVSGPEQGAAGGERATVIQAQNTIHAFLDALLSTQPPGAIASIRAAVDVLGRAALRSAPPTTEGT